MATLIIDPAAPNPQKLQMPAGTLGALQELYRVFINGSTPRPVFFVVVTPQGADGWTIPIGTPVRFHIPADSFNDEQTERLNRQIKQLQDRANNGVGITFDETWELVGDPTNP